MSASDSSPSRSGSRTEEVDRRCGAFETRWRAGTRGSIEAELANCSPALRPALLRELIAVEIQLRREDGESVDVEQYRARFPKDLGAVRIAWESSADDEDGVHEASFSTASVSASTVDRNDATVPSGQAASCEPLVQLGRYEIQKVLGQGGFGRVYLAHDPQLQRMVALKVIRPDRLICLSDHDRETAIERFQNEARGTAKLEQENIVTVYDVGEIDGLPYYAMRYVEGRALIDLVRNEPLTNVRAAKYILEASRAIQAAHEAQILHRDVKPQNILIDEHTDRALLADFGLAKLLEANHEVTMTGDVFGSPSYMAPEQARDASHVTTSADIYGLGATLYHCLTGRPPFLTPTITETLRQVCEGQPVAPRQINSAIDRDLETICLKCLEKDPKHRYGTARELGDDLQRYQEDRPIQARPIGPIGRLWRWSRRNPIVAILSATALVLLAATAVVATIGYWTTSAAVQREMAARRRETKQRHEAETQKQKADEERGKAEQRKNEVQQLAGDLLVNEVAQLRQTRPMGWSWKGLDNVARAVKLKGIEQCDVRALRNEATACLAATDLREITRLNEGRNVFRVKFSPDSRYLAVAESRTNAYFFPCKIWVHDLQTMQEQVLTFPMARVMYGMKMEPDGSRGLAFSPDGKWLVVGTRGGWIYRWDRTQKNSKPVGWKTGAKDLYGLAFSPDSSSLYSKSGRGLLVRWDVKDGWKEAASYQTSYKTIFDFVIWPDGSQIILHDDVIRVLDPKTLEVTKTIDLHVGYHLRLIGNGPLLAVDHGDEIRIVDTETGTVVRHITEPIQARSTDFYLGPIAISSDGLFAVTAGHEHKIRLWDLANGRLATSTMLGGQGDYRPEFSPDGCYVATTGPDCVILYEARCGQCLTARAHQTFPLEGFAMSAQSEQIATMAADREDGQSALGLWTADGKRRIKYWPLPTTPFSQSARLSIAADSTGLQWVFSLPSGVVGRCRMTDDAKLQLMDSNRATHVTFAPDGNTVWGIVDENQVVCWDSKDFTVRAQWDNTVSALLTGFSGINGVVTSAHHTLVGMNNGFATLFDSSSLEMLHSWIPNSGPTTAVSLAPDESLAAFGTENGVVHIARIRDKKIVAKEQAHEDRVTTVAFGPHGNYVASGARDGSIVLWRKQGETYVSCLTLSEHTSSVRQLAFTQDGAALAVAIEGEWGVRFWKLDAIEESLDKLGIGWQPR